MSSVPYPLDAVLVILTPQAMTDCTGTAQAVGAFMHLVSYARNLEILHETPRDIPVAFSLDRGRGFTINDDSEEDVVLVARDLA